MRGGGGSGSVLRAVLGGFAAPDPVLPPPVIPGDAGRAVRGAHPSVPSDCVSINVNLLPCRLFCPWRCGAEGGPLPTPTPSILPSSLPPFRRGLRSAGRAVRCGPSPPHSAPGAAAARSGERGWKGEGGVGVGVPLRVPGLRERWSQSPALGGGVCPEDGAPCGHEPPGALRRGAGMLGAMRHAAVTAAAVGSSRVVRTSARPAMLRPQSPPGAPLPRPEDGGGSG